MRPKLNNRATMVFHLEQSDKAKIMNDAIENNINMGQVMRKIIKFYYDNKGGNNDNRN